MSLQERDKFLKKKNFTQISTENFKELCQAVKEEKIRVIEEEAQSPSGLYGESPMGLEAVTDQVSEEQSPSNRSRGYSVKKTERSSPRRPR